MFRQMFFGFLHGADPLAADRWYFGHHAPELVHFAGPWLRRYETYRLLSGAGDSSITQSGFQTEIWWDSLESFREAGGEPTGWMDARFGGLARPYTPAPFREEVGGLPGIVRAMTLIPALPTDDFLGTQPNPNEPMVRLFRVLRYAGELSQEAGERWYHDVHVPRVRQQKSLRRFVSYETLEYPPAHESGPYGQWSRVEELWYPDLASWRQDAVDPDHGFVDYDGPGDIEFVSEFVRVRRDVDFLRDPLRVP